MTTSEWVELNEKRVVVVLFVGRRPIHVCSRPVDARGNDCGLSILALRFFPSPIMDVIFWRLVERSR